MKAVRLVGASAYLRRFNDPQRNHLRVEFIKAATMTTEGM